MHATYARDLSKPQADFTLAVFALIAALFAVIMTCNAWARRKNLKKIDQAGKVAAVLAGAGDGTASRRDDRG
jgi:phosphotransferase system  glucose/maltose/N-acetylglucosamine-specific IIC component